MSERTKLFLALVAIALTPFIFFGWIAMLDRWIAWLVGQP